MSGDNEVLGPPAQRESRWPATLAVAAAIGLSFVLPDQLVLGPRWLIPGLEALIGALLMILRPFRHASEEAHVRVVAIALIALVSLANGSSVVLLVHRLLYGTITQGRSLVLAAASIWVTNVIVFGLWYWELDRGGPALRAGGGERNPDFLFPQMSLPRSAPPGWRPTFIDYLYVALTNAAAFSPTDTMPLTPMAKSLMSTQSLVSLLTIVVVAARAVNILH